MIGKLVKLGGGALGGVVVVGLTAWFVLGRTTTRDVVDTVRGQVEDTVTDYVDPNIALRNAETDYAADAAADLARQAEYARGLDEFIREQEEEERIDRQARALVEPQLAEVQAKLDERDRTGSRTIAYRNELVGRDDLVRIGGGILKARAELDERIAERAQALADARAERERVRAERVETSEHWADFRRSIEAETRRLEGVAARERMVAMRQARSLRGSGGRRAAALETVERVRSASERREAMVENTGADAAPGSAAAELRERARLAEVERAIREAGAAPTPPDEATTGDGILERRGF